MDWRTVQFMSPVRFSAAVIAKPAIPALQQQAALRIQTARKLSQAPVPMWAVTRNNKALQLTELGVCGRNWHSRTGFVAADHSMQTVFKFASAIGWLTFEANM